MKAVRNLPRPPHGADISRRMRSAVVVFVAALVAVGCGSPREGGDDDDGGDIDAGETDIDAGQTDTDAAPTDCGTAPECAAAWEENAADRFEAILGDAPALAAFLKAM